MPQSNWTRSGESTNSLSSNLETCSIKENSRFKLVIIIIFYFFIIFYYLESFPLCYLSANKIDKLKLLKKELERIDPSFEDNYLEDAINEAMDISKIYVLTLKMSKNSEPNGHFSRATFTMMIIPVYASS